MTMDKKNKRKPAHPRINDVDAGASTAKENATVPRDIQLLMAEREAMEALRVIGAKYNCEIITSYKISIEIKAIERTNDQ